VSNVCLTCIPARWTRFLNAGQLPVVTGEQHVYLTWQSHWNNAERYKDEQLQGLQPALEHRVSFSSYA